MKLTVFLLCLLACESVVYAQPQQQTLNGVISLGTGETFPYKLVFTENDGQIKGYSITYKEPDDTKTSIKGRLDRHNHLFSFKETDIIYSHGFQTHAFMCLIDADLEYVAGRGNILIGPIASKETDKTVCTGGSVIFNKEEEVRNLFSYHEKYDTVISFGRKPPPQAIAPVAATPAGSTPLVTERITAGIEKTYVWHTDTVVLDVWDGGNIDGDRVTVSFNGKAVLTNYFLVKEKRQLRLPLAAGKTNIITILADNEGSDPPNTASLLLTDGSQQYSVLAYNPKGQEVMLKIKR